MSQSEKMSMVLRVSLALWSPVNFRHKGDVISLGSTILISQNRKIDRG